MISTLERRLAHLESENNARKASYPVAGSLVPFISQSSQVWTRSGGNSTPIWVRIRFTPENPSDNGRHLVQLSPQVSISSNMSNLWPRFYFYNEPQQGNGEVIVNLQIATLSQVQTYYFRVTASGSSRGAFTIV